MQPEITIYKTSSWYTIQYHELLGSLYCDTGLKFKNEKLVRARPPYDDKEEKLTICKNITKYQ
jgi:hypothetical protein